MKLKLGLIVSLREDPNQEIEKVRKLGFPTCQVSCWSTNLYNRKVAQHLRKAAEDNHVEITTIWAGLPGRYVWDFIEGPTTIGLVPPGTREERLKTLRKASEFAHKVGVESITTHVGFIPEDPKDPVYVSLIDVLSEVARFCNANGQSFWFETGQETPVTLLRTIEDVIVFCCFSEVLRDFPVAAR